VPSIIRGAGSNGSLSSRGCIATERNRRRFAGQLPERLLSPQYKNKTRASAELAGRPKTRVQEFPMIVASSAGPVLPPAREHGQTPGGISDESREPR
jgi:hypothetical protein